MELPAVDDEDWLEFFIVESLNRQLCTKIMCTTCGALEFRMGLMLSLAQAAGQPLASEFDLARAGVLARGLARLKPPLDRSSNWEQAVRLMLFEVWRSVGSATADRKVEPLLTGSWAGEVLAGMKTHERLRQEARQRHAETQGRQQRERAERLRLKQENHAERLERKRERDRLWCERKGSIES